MIPLRYLFYRIYICLAFYDCVSPSPLLIFYMYMYATHLVIKMTNSEVADTDDNLMQQFLGVVVGTVPDQVASDVTEL